MTVYFNEVDLSEFIEQHVPKLTKGAMAHNLLSNSKPLIVVNQSLTLAVGDECFFLYPRHPTGLSFQLMNVLLHHGAYTTLCEAIYLKLEKHK